MTPKKDMECFIFMGDLEVKNKTRKTKKVLEP